MARRGNLVFRFSATDQGVGSVIHTFEEEEAEADAFVIMNPRWRGFSDLMYYQRLCAEPGCVKVCMSRVRCLHNQYFMGLQVVYRSTFANEATREYACPERFFVSGYYAIEGGTRNFSTLDLEDEEFITGLRLNQGEILDGVTFVTNRREVHFGGHGGSRYEDSMMMSTRLNAFRIVAFTGSELGVMHRIGYFAENISWETIRPLVMLRWLVERERASLSLSIEECTKEQLVVRTLVGADSSETLPDEIFRHVLWFLIDCKKPH